MPTGSRIQANVKCPFYISDTDRPYTVKCEGLENTKFINVEFSNRQQKKDYIDSKCSDRYRYCWIYRLLSYKYRD